LFYIAYRHLKTLFDLREAFPIRRLVWSLDNRLQWSVEMVLRTLRSK
jgi:hypothetical protein